MGREIERAAYAHRCMYYLTRSHCRGTQGANKKKLWKTILSRGLSVSTGVVPKTTVGQDHSLP
jgi:hypothetical protein